jgi:transposase
MRRNPFWLSDEQWKRIEGRLPTDEKDFRRIATRYDKLARNYLASVCLAAVLVWWI